MTGEQFWKLAFDARISDDHLRALAYDLYFARKAPTGDGKVAVNQLATKLGINPAYVYAALNIDPGKQVLETLGEDYAQRQSWPRVKSTTSAYISKVAARIKIIRDATATPKTPPIKASVPAATGAPTQSKRLTLWPFGLGFAGIIMGLFCLKGVR